MKQTIRVFVRVPDRLFDGKFKELYRNKIMVDDSVNFNFSFVMQALNLLYPVDDKIIDFEIS